MRPSFARNLAWLLWLGASLLAAAQPPGPSRWPAELDPAHLPWADGEALTYRVSCLGLDAAEGTFLARHLGSTWEFKLALASRGLVDRAYPFTGTFWSILGQAPWRSVEYGEFRFEPARTIRERTRIDYTAQSGTREIWTTGETKRFPVRQPALDDLGTMLYNLRCGDWPAGRKRTLFVYESDEEKQAEAISEGPDLRVFAPWPAQRLIRLRILPTVGTHRRGSLVLWLTDDARRLPLHAELAFRYGAFSMDLLKVETVPVATPQAGQAAGPR